MTKQSHKPNFGFIFCSLFAMQRLHDYLRLNFKRLSPLNYLLCFNDNALACGLVWQCILFFCCLNKPIPTKPKFGISKPLSKPQITVLNGFEMAKMHQSDSCNKKVKLVMNENEWRVAA